MGMETTIDREKEKLREKDRKIYLESGKQMPLKSERVEIQIHWDKFENDKATQRTKQNGEKNRERPHLTLAFQWRS